MTKAKCLGLLGGLIPNRLGRVANAAKFMSKFPLRGFILQGGQALQTLTGYGVALGALEGLKTDITWAILRGNPLAKVRIVGPPPSDIFGKATRYLLQPAYHYFAGDVFTFEEHLLLSSADAVASMVVRDSGPMGDLPDRWAVAQNSPVIGFEAWHPATLEVVSELGLSPVATDDVLFMDSSVPPTYGGVTEALIRGFPDWIVRVAGEFPRTSSATWLAQLIAASGQETLNYLSEGEGQVSPIYTPSELAFARMFEYGLFPPGQVEGQQMNLAIERSLEIAAAVGREYPGREDLEEALLEVFGSLGA